LWTPSRRPINGKVPAPASFGLWLATRTAKEWPIPAPFGPAVNKWAVDISAGFAGDGTLYFTSHRPDAAGVYCSCLRGGEYGEMEVISSRLPKTDVLITTALVYGRKAPLLITEDMVKLMQPGSVVIDLAAEQGGNCALSQPGKTAEKYGVTIYGAVDLPSQLPLHTSLMYSKNVLNAFNNLYAGEDDSIDLEDEINAHARATHKGEVISELVRDFLAKKGGDS
jgi:hypothetical protein